LRQQVFKLIKMEEIQPQPLFSLSIDPVTKTHLSETARWARFLAIVGMISVGLMVVFGLIYSIWLSSMVSSVQGRYGVQTPGAYAGGVAIGSAVMFVVMAVVTFFPMLYMLRFANQMKTALYGNDQENLNSSFQNLKRYFRYVGIITIIGIGIWIIWLLVFGFAILALR
jgi:hypothetical protein